jgi:hypothetical protein
MEEAIREAISAEIAHIELPYGSVPVVAILGFSNIADGDAIVVRPNCIRPAHFERSIFFGSAGLEGSDQRRDAIRTEDAVRAAELDSGGLADVGGMFRKFAQQIGASFAHRLWQGRFLTSNISVTGALLDFGSFRAVPSWRRFVGLPEETFGLEHHYLQIAWRSVISSFRKYSQDPRTLPWEFNVSFQRDIEEAFAAATREALALPEDQQTSSRVVSVLHAYALEQQRQVVAINQRSAWRMPWIGDLEEVGLGPCTTRSESELLREITSLLGSSEEDEQPAGRALRPALKRWTIPRRDLYYERSSLLLRRVARRLRHDGNRGPALLKMLITLILSRSIRSWPGLKSCLEIRAQTHAGHSTVLYCFDHSTQHHLALVRGTRCQGGGENIWGRTIKPGKDPPDQGWHEVRCAPDALHKGATATLGEVSVALPSAQGFFGAPALATPLIFAEFRTFSS